MLSCVHTDLSLSPQTFQLYNIVHVLLKCRPCFLSLLLCVTIFSNVSIYRMNHDIMKWPSLYLYNDSLKAHESVSEHLLKYINVIKTYIISINTGTFLPLPLLQ